MRRFENVLQRIFCALLVITVVYGCGGGNDSEGDNSNSQPQNQGQIPGESLTPPIPDPREAIAFQKAILAKRQRLDNRSIYYNRDDALDYVRRFNEVKDERFRYFGNQCTAYASQTLWAGGVPMYGNSIPGYELFYRLAWNWWYSDWSDKRPDNGLGPDMRQSISWLNTDSFWWFLYYRVGILVDDLSTLEPGDIVSVDYEDNHIFGISIPRIDHTFIVMEVKPTGEVICAANSPSQIDRSLWKVILDYPDYPVLFWGWHIDSSWIDSPDHDWGDGDPDNGGGGTSPPPTDGGDGGSPPVFPHIPPPGGGGGGDDDSLPPPPEPDRTAPIIESSSIDFKGDGKYNLIATVSDSESGIDYTQFYLQNPGYNFIPVGSKNWEVSTLLEVNLTGRAEGTWKFFVEAWDKEQNHLDKTDTGARIYWGKPWKEWSELIGPNQTGQSIYRAQFNSPSGHEGVQESYLLVKETSNIFHQVGDKQTGWQGEWQFNPLNFPTLERGKAYEAVLVIIDKNGCKADQVPAGNYLTVPDQVFPEENLPMPLYTPANWTENSHGIWIADVIKPPKPTNDQIPITVKIDGDNLANLDRWCVVVYGYKDNPNWYKQVSGYQTVSDKEINCTVNTHDLPTGQLTIGVIFYLKGDSQTGYLIMSYGRILVDKDPPKPDETQAIVEGPASGSELEIGGQLTIRFAAMDPGGSRTQEVRLQLWDLRTGRKFPAYEIHYGYMGIYNFPLDGATPGRLDLEYWAEDNAGNNTGNPYDGAGYKLSGLYFTAVEPPSPVPDEPTPWPDIPPETDPGDTPPIMPPPGD